MKVLVVHNSYLQPGGEDVVFEQETQLLRNNHDQVVEFHCQNAEINGGLRQKLNIARNAIWANGTARAIRDLIVRERPDVAHFHNVFNAISPSCYYACRELDVPVVQTVHNYRLMCPSSDFFRDGQICQSCLGKSIAWPGVVHGCYHASRLETGVVAMMIAAHHWWETWLHQIDTYIATSGCVRNKLIQGGFPANKIVVKPNFIDPDPGFQEERVSRYAIFAGRLSREKGAAILVEAWRRISDLPLLIAGDGPQAPELERLIASSDAGNVQMLGYRPRSELLHLLKGASLLIFPSQWQETFGLAVIEAFACGVPVIATRLGALPELIDHFRTGLLCDAGSVQALAETIQWAINHPPEMETIRRAARKEYEQRYTAAANYPLLRRIYEHTLRQFAADSERVSTGAMISTGDGGRI
jgi:glycosyltransferase involved in cell wall biosynthesis